MRLRSTTRHRSPENVGIIPIVEPELKFIQIQRQIFLADISGILPYAKLSS